MSDWQLVPVEPTKEMTDAARKGIVTGGGQILGVSPLQMYRAMLAAAPVADDVQSLRPCIRVMRDVMLFHHEFHGIIGPTDVKHAIDVANALGADTWD